MFIFRRPLGDPGDQFTPTESTSLNWLLAMTGMGCYSDDRRPDSEYRYLLFYRWMVQTGRLTEEVEDAAAE
jgi:hypothetical protein